MLATRSNLKRALCGLNKAHSGTTPVHRPGDGSGVNSGANFPRPTLLRDVRTGGPLYQGGADLRTPDL